VGVPESQELNNAERKLGAPAIMVGKTFDRAYTKRMISNGDEPYE
jgi:hypothetical protein